MRLSLLLALLIALAVTGPAQGQAIGGLSTYEFLNLPASARLSALGGQLIAVPDDDVNLALGNPALLNPAMGGQIAFSHAFHLADVQHGYVAFGLDRPTWQTTLHGGLQYIRYGEFTRTDEFGDEQGTFQVGEYAFTVGAARQWEERLSVGANLRLVNSQIESYSSLGVMADVAARYRDTSGLFNISLVLRNAGRQLTTYREGNVEPLPFEMLIGLSKRLRYLPFRFSATYRYLNRWNVLYDDPNVRDESILLGGETPPERSPASIWFDNFFRHFVFSGELLIGKQDNFRLRVGYNHLMRQELSVGDFRSLAGFSFGVGFKVNRFRIDYGRTAYHLAGGVNHLSIATNLKEFRGK